MQRLAGAVHRFWYLHGHLTEGRRRFDEVLALDRRPTLARARALTGASVVAFNLNQDDDSKRFIEEAREIYSGFGDAGGVAYALMMLGNLADSVGNRHAVLDLYRQSAEGFRRVGDTDREGIARDNWANELLQLGELDEARDLLGANLERARSRGDRRLEAMALGGLGGLARRTGQAQQALEYFRQGLAYWHEVGVPQFVAREMSGVARALAMVGESQTAALLVGRSMSLYEEIGAVDPVQVEYDEETLTLVREHLDKQETSRALRDGRSLELAVAVRVALGELPAADSAGELVR